MNKWQMGMLGMCVLSSAAIGFSADDSPRKPRDAAPPAKRLDPARMLSQFDKNDDGFIDEKEAPAQIRQRFARIDSNGDGKLSKQELENMGDARNRPRTRKTETPQPEETASKKPDGDAPQDALFRLLDKDNDGKLSKEELEDAVRLLQRDKNKDGAVDLQELLSSNDGRRPGEMITKAAKGERHEDKLKVGDDAPDFTLPDKSGKREITLSELYPKKPVVLIFASYT